MAKRNQRGGGRGGRGDKPPKPAAAGAGGEDKPATPAAAAAAAATSLDAFFGGIRDVTDDEVGIVAVATDGDATPAAIGWCCIIHGAKSMMVPANSITDEEWDEILATGGDIHEYDEKEDAVAAFAMLHDCADVATESEAREHNSSAQHAAPAAELPPRGGHIGSTELPSSAPPPDAAEQLASADRAILTVSSAPPGLTSPSSSANARYAGAGDPLGPTPLPGSLAQPEKRKILAIEPGSADRATDARPGSPAYTPFQSTRRSVLSSAPRRLSAISRLPARSTRSHSIRLGGEVCASISESAPSSETDASM